MTDKRCVTARLNPTRKAKLEALANVCYRGAQADVIRTWIDEQYDLIFGDLNPDAIEDGRIPESTAEQFVAADEDPRELADDLGIDSSVRLDTDQEVVPAVADGGAAVAQPESYSAMLSPSELRQSGPALEWEDLREIVADDGRWSDSLTIHPDRVPDSELKSNHKYASRVVAAVARHEAVDGILFESDLRDLVDEHLLHLHDRADERAGKQYIRSTYLPLVADHLWPHPDPRKEFFFVDREKYEDAVTALIDDPFPSLNDRNLDTEDLFKRERYMAATGFEFWSDDAQTDHRDAVADWLGDLARLWTLQLDHDLSAFEDRVAYPDEHPDLSLFLIQTVKDLLRRFDRGLDQQTRADILDHHAADAVADIIRDIGR